MDAWSPLYGQYAGPESPALLGVVGLAAVATAVLLGLALAAFVRRRSQPYLLIASAVVALFARSVVAGFTVAGAIAPRTHHLVEHALDVVLVALVVAAVYYARTTVRSLDSDP